MKRSIRLALAVGLFVSIAPLAEAASVTCNLGGDVDPIFPGVAYRCETISNFFATGTDVSALYVFDPVAPSVGMINNNLEFDQVLHDMVVTMSAFFVAPGNQTFLDRLPDGFTPTTFNTTDGAAWVYFRVEDLQDGLNPDTAPNSGPPKQGVDFAGNWTQTISWFAFGGTQDLLFDVLHDSRPIDLFTAVITVPGSFNPSGVPCTSGCFPPPCDGRFCPEGDPAIGGSADDFSDTLVVQRPIPEPGTIVLVLSGMVGAGLRRPRRNHAALNAGLRSRDAQSPAPRG